MDLELRAGDVFELNRRLHLTSAAVATRACRCPCHFLSSNSESSAESADTAHSLQVLGLSYNSSTHDASSTPKLQVLLKPRWGRYISGRKGQVVESEVLVYIGDGGTQSDMSILGPSHLHSAVNFIRTQ